MKFKLLLSVHFVIMNLEINFYKYKNVTVRCLVSVEMECPSGFVSVSHHLKSQSVHIEGG